MVKLTSECSDSDTTRKDRNGDGTSSNKYVPFYTRIALKTNDVYSSHLFFFLSLIAIPIAPSIVLCNSPMAAQVQCYGCNRVFSPRGLSQHITRSQDIRCRHKFTISDSQIRTTPGSSTASSTAPIPIDSSRVTADITAGDEFPLENGEVSNQSSDLDAGEFAITCVAVVAAQVNIFGHVFSLFHTTDDSNSNFEGGLDSTPDAADIADADAFEELAQNIDFLSELAPISNQPTIDNLPGAPTLNHVEAQPNQHEADNMGMAPIVVIDHFPSGQAGAPIPGMARGSSIYESCGTLMWTRNGSHSLRSATGCSHIGPKCTARHHRP